MYRDGLSVAQSYDEAFKWYQKSAEQGHKFAQSKLGVMYHEGKGVPKNDDKARVWFQKAAAQGETSAKYYLMDL